jgi:hypothetical protein
MTKPRKGVKYTSELDVLLRDAQPTRLEIENEPDLQKRRERQRARDIATDALIALFREHETQGRLKQLDFRVRLFFEQLKSRRGKLPKRKGGRPSSSHQQLLIAVGVREGITANGGRRGGVAKAIREIFERYRKRFGIQRIETIKDIHYNPNPEWQRTVDTELARRKYEAGCWSSEDTPGDSPEPSQSNYSEPAKKEIFGID